MSDFNASELSVLTEVDLPEHRAGLNQIIGAKATELFGVPSLWRLPIAVVPTVVYATWKQAKVGCDREKVLVAVAESICKTGKAWEALWPSGLILRSSAQDETLADRGRFETKALPADFDTKTVAQCVAEIYTTFSETAGAGKIAILLQPYLAAAELGHISNERRVSPTENRWVYEPLRMGAPTRSFNSWRREPDPSQPLLLNKKNGAKDRMPEAARWLTKLKRGRCIAEIGITNDRIFLLQIDFENDSPESGVDPAVLLRPPDARPSGALPLGSPIEAVDLDAGLTGWRKVDNALLFKRVRGEQRYPQLFSITGDKLLEAKRAGRDVAADVSAVTHDRAVVRTACQSEKIPALNQPRTDCTDGPGALAFMETVLAEWATAGVMPAETCFVIHKFIPASACAWAYASPKDRSVLIDGLWGVPDGLQYYAHDTFEYDVTLDEVVARKVRYKPAFIQEQPDGTWRLLRVARPYTRRTSLTTKSICEVGRVTQAIAELKGSPTMVMWFCEIAEEAGIGTNLPWFLMPAPDDTQGNASRATPDIRRFRIANFEDIEKLTRDNEKGGILEVHPAVEHVREPKFLEAVIAAAQRGEFSVELSGSVRGHAFHQIHAAGVTVFHSDPIAYARIRKKQSFGKLVRDEIPANIERRGESARLARIEKSESRRALLAKLQEEMFELSEARSPEQVAAELADVLEVVRSLAMATGIDWKKVEQGADDKKRERGSFEKNVVLLETGVLPPGRPSSPHPETIRLADLAKISRMTEAVLPFAALYAEGADTTVTLGDGRTISLKLERSGISAQLVPLEAKVAAVQLELDLGM